MYILVSQVIFQTYSNKDLTNAGDDFPTFMITKQQHQHNKDNIFLESRQTLKPPLHCVQKKTPTHIFFHISMSDE